MALTPKSIEFLKEIQLFSGIAVKPTKKIIVDQVKCPEFKPNITKYREIFPKMMLPSGVAGRQPLPELESKFINFFKMFPEHSWELILAATQKYVDKYAQKDYEYMKCSTHFISKQDKFKNVVWELASQCDMFDVEDVPADEYYKIISR